MSSTTNKTSKSQKLGLISLVAIVVSSMIGSGVDGLPQNMAANSALGPIIIAWLICGFGMFFIARTFIVLSDIRPDLQSGIYMYAREGFGPFIAFNVAWGYWLMNIFSNVAFAVIVMDALNYFFPGDFQGGNNLASIIGASILIWGFNFIVLSGTRDAGIINTLGTFIKLIPLVIFVFVLVYSLNYTQLTTDFWGHTPANHQQKLGTVLSQVLSPLDVALWCFIGIEGAVALSGRARNKADIGKATLIGFVISLGICILISVLPFGVLNQAQLATIPTPSTAGVLKEITGLWGEWLINLGVVVSVLTSWLAWTMICAEIPMIAAQNGTFPESFARKNNRDTASFSLYTSTIFMQLVMLLVYFSHHAWITMLSIASVTVLPAYLASNAYLFKLCLSGEYDKYASKGKVAAVISSIIGMVFCFFMFYASQMQYVAFTPILLTIGLPLFVWTRREKKDHLPVFRQHEVAILIILLLLDALVLWLWIQGIIIL